MQLKTVALVAAALVSGTQACFFTAHSSTVGDFKVQHSEPHDHGGARQTMTGSKGSCSFSANLADGCVVTVQRNSGCGSLSFTRNGSG